MDKWSNCDNCGSSHIYHAHNGSDRRDPKEAPYNACPIGAKLERFSKTKTFEHQRSSMIPDCVPNGGIEIGDGYYRG